MSTKTYSLIRHDGHLQLCGKRLFSSGQHAGVASAASGAGRTGLETRTHSRRQIHKELVQITKRNSGSKDAKVQALNDYVSRYGHNFDALSIVTALSSYASLQISSQLLWTRVRNLMSPNENRATTMASAAFGSGSRSHQTDLSSEQPAGPSNFSASEVSQIIHAAAKLSCKDEGMHCLRHLLERYDFPAQFESRDVSIVLWSLAKLRLDGPDTQLLVLRYCVWIADTSNSSNISRPFEEYSVNSLAQVLRAFTDFTQIKEQPTIIKQLLDELTWYRQFHTRDSSATTAGASINAQTLCSIMQCLELRFPKACDQEKNHIRQLVSKQVATPSLKTIELTPQGLANIVKAGAVMDFDLFSGYLACQAARANWLSNWFELRTLLYALARTSRIKSNLTGCTSSEVRDFLRHAIRPLLTMASKRMDPNLAAVALWTYASHRLKSDQLMMALLKIPKKEERDIANCLWSVAVLQAGGLGNRQHSRNRTGSEADASILEHCLRPVKDKLLTSSFRCWKSLINICWSLCVLQQHDLLDLALPNIALLKNEKDKLGAGTTKPQSKNEKSARIDGLQDDEQTRSQLSYICATFHILLGKPSGLETIHNSRPVERTRPSATQSQAVTVLRKYFGMEAQAEYGIEELNNICIADLCIQFHGNSQNAAALASRFGINKEELLQKKGLVVEIDGPRHFVECLDTGAESPTGASHLREALIRGAGYRFVMIRSRDLFEAKTHQVQAAHFEDAIRKELCGA